MTKIQNRKTESQKYCLEFWIYNFEFVSDFEFRISNFRPRGHVNRLPEKLCLRILVPYPINPYAPHNGFQNT
jgi:hypothetical protein